MPRSIFEMFTPVKFRLMRQGFLAEATACRAARILAATNSRKGVLRSRFIAKTQLP